jgi:hypothetical protein
VAVRRDPRDARERWQAALFWATFSAATVAVWVWVPVT